MPDIFSSRAGYVAVITDPGGTILPGRVSVDGFDPQSALIAGVNYNQKTNQQFSQSLDGSVYIYVFGDLMGDVEVEGVGFGRTCQGGAEGITEILNFYKNHRASKISTPITIQLGGETISGFLTALSLKNTALADDPASAMVQYKFLISTLPGN